jgi:hypothetical protein
MTNLPETVTIATDEYLRLVEDSANLDGLRAAGVDNWDGYSEVDWDAIESTVENARAALTAAVTRTPAEPTVSGMCEVGSDGATCVVAHPTHRDIYHNGHPVLDYAKEN